VIPYILYLIILFIVDITLFRLSINSYRNRENDAFLNNIIHSMTLLIALLVSLLGPNRDLILIYPFELYIIFFTIPFYIIFYILVKLERKRVQRNRSRLKDIEIDEKTMRELPFKYEVYRKLTHLVVIFICFVYFLFSVLVKLLVDFIINLFPDFFYELLAGESIINLSSVEFAQYLVLFLTSISLIGLLTADYVRIIYPEDYPFKTVNRLLRRKELKTRIGPHISMAVGTMSIVLIFGPLTRNGPLIVCAAILMSNIGDSTANLVGRYRGHHKIRGGKKSYEGLIMGILSSFSSGVLFLLYIFYIFPDVIILPSVFIVPLVVSLVLGLIDYLDVSIDDNLTYLLATSVLVYLLL